MAQNPILAVITPPSVKVQGDADDAPVRVIKASELLLLGQKLNGLFMQYVSDRRIAELRWLRNQRQYLGIYDPEVEKVLSPNRSHAYPKLTRIKCVSVLSRLMNLMFPGNELNWSLKAAPHPDFTLDDVQEAMQAAQAANQAAGTTPTVDLDYCMTAIQDLMDKRAEKLTVVIDGQLQELGGDQTLDYIALNRKVIQSGILYGMGVLRGPFARPGKSVTWDLTNPQQPKPKTIEIFKPMFEFLPVWDFYPDMSAKTFASMDGYFVRKVLSRAQLRALCKRPDFFETQIKAYLRQHPMGNYRPQPYETDLRAMGVKVNVNEMKPETMKYEINCWHGATSGEFLRASGVTVADDKITDDLDAEVWMVDGIVIKCDLNPWAALGVEVKDVHTFLFDEDDTSPVGSGLPNVMRDSQMAVSAAARMLLDNASAVCGPQLELNTDLLRPDQDLVATGAYKVWYRTGEDANAQFPAVRNIEINAHMKDLMAVISLFKDFADSETFVGAATGGDMANMPSEPMRTAAGATAIRGDAALPFKDVVRAYDTFTQSVIESLVQFNKKFNPKVAPEGDYDVIARGATSMIAKEVRGAAIDNFVMTAKPEEMIELDARKLVTARLKARDLEDLMVSPSVSAQRHQANSDKQSQDDKNQQDQIQATIKKLLSDAFKNVAAGQQHSAAADAVQVNTALAIVEKGITDGSDTQGAAGQVGNKAPAGKPVRKQGQSSSPAGV